MKIFRDPIYGYVSIPKNLCADFIDSYIFQRLRRIEQTSMRVLYPSAHHDRFAHSIGVFHLGSIAFSNLKKNSKDSLSYIKLEQWELYKNTFEIACLMHDCGHSPFSHTFEHYYLFKRDDEIKNRIAKFFDSDKDFSTEYDSASPAPHEKISALLLLEQFSDLVIKNGANPELAARMIIGCRYEQNPSTLNKFENRLISLLNGTGIDVDSLDYIQRDSWASGVSNVNIDYHRLLSSLSIMPDKNDIPQIVFKKRVLSVIDNIAIGRNFLYKWIYSHHKVLYEQNLLSEIIEKINGHFSGEFCAKIFSIESFTSRQKFNGTTYLLPTDDDIIHTIKQFNDEFSQIEEFLSRKYLFKALWKTAFEFDAYFNELGTKEKMAVFTRIEKGALNSKYGENNMLILEAKPKLKGINSNDFFIDIDDQLIDAKIATNQLNENLKYSIIYTSEEILVNKEEFISDILKLQS